MGWPSMVWLRRDGWTFLNWARYREGYHSRLPEHPRQLELCFGVKIAYQHVGRQRDLLVSTWTIMAALPTAGPNRCSNATAVSSSNGTAEQTDTVHPFLERNTKNLPAASSAPSSVAFCGAYPDLENEELAAEEEPAVEEGVMDMACWIARMAEWAEVEVVWAAVVRLVRGNRWPKTTTTLVLWCSNETISSCPILRLRSFCSPCRAASSEQIFLELSVDQLAHNRVSSQATFRRGN